MVLGASARGRGRGRCLLECLGVVHGEFHALPQLGRRVRTLHRLHVQEHAAVVLTNRCVARIRQRTSSRKKNKKK